MHEGEIDGIDGRAEEMQQHERKREGEGEGRGRLIHLEIDINCVRKRMRERLS